MAKHFNILFFFPTLNISSVKCALQITDDFDGVHPVPPETKSIHFAFRSSFGNMWKLNFLASWTLLSSHHATQHNFQGIMKINSEIVYLP